MKMQSEESKQLVVKELETATKLVEQIPSADVPVTGDETVDKLIAENQNLKILVKSLEWKIAETEKKYEERNIQALEAESKITQLKSEMQRMSQTISVRLAYWLFNASTLLFLLQRSLKDSRAPPA